MAQSIQPIAYLHAVRDEESPDYDGKPPTRHRHMTIIEDDVLDTILGTLGCSAFGVYAHLARRANKDRQAWPSLAAIMDATQLSESTVRRSLKHLKAHGWITTEERRNRFGVHAGYIFTLPHHNSRTYEGVTPPSEVRHGSVTAPSNVPPEVDTKKKQSNPKGTEILDDAPKAKRQVVRATPAPASFPLSPEHIEKANEYGVPPDLVSVETDKFLDYHRSKGSTFKDWQAAWRNWMRNSRRFGAVARGSPNGRVRQGELSMDDLKRMGGWEE